MHTNLIKLLQQPHSALLPIIIYCLLQKHSRHQQRNGLQFIYRVSHNKLSFKTDLLLLVSLVFKEELYLSSHSSLFFPSAGYSPKWHQFLGSRGCLIREQKVLHVGVQNRNNGLRPHLTNQAHFFFVLYYYFMFIYFC